MKRLDWKLIAGLATVLILSVAAFLVVMAPASVAFSFIRDDLARDAPGVLVTGVGGTVWNGAANVEFEGFPASVLTWSEVDLSPFDREVQTLFRLSAPSHNVYGAIRASETLLHLADTTGYIDHTWVNPWGANYGLSFAGGVNVTRIELTANRRWLTALDANLNWTGGTVRYTAYGETQTYTLPALDVSARLDGDVIRADVTQAGETVIEVSLDPDGSSYVAVKARLFLLASLPWPGGQPANENVIEVERPLW